MINYDKIPAHCRDGMKLYIENGIPTGSFLYAVLTNDFVGAIGKADDINQLCLKNYAEFLYWEAPSDCWGSPEIVNNWQGLNKERSA